MAGAIVAAWLVFAVFVSVRNPVVLLSDCFGFMDRARHLSLTDASAWVHGLWPFGYPLALRAVFALTGDYEQAGRLLSIGTCAASLIAVYALGACCFSRPAALLGLLVCASNPSVIVWGINTCTDMPATACAVAAVFFAARSERGGMLVERDLVTAGLFTGLGYLFRYTNLLLVPAFIVWIWARPRDDAAMDRPSLLLRRVAAFVLAFLLVSSPQMVLSTIVKGSPLWNQQAANVYFGMFGDMNWGTGWYEAAKHTSIREVILAHPRQFAAHFLRNVLSVPMQQIVQYPFAFLAAAGVVLSLDRGRAANTAQYSRRLLVVLAAVAYSLGVCLAYCLPRYLLLVAMLSSMLAGFGFEQCVPRYAVIFRSRRVPVGRPLLLLFLAMVLYRHLVVRALHPLSEDAATKIQVTQVLRDDGNTDPSSVLSLGLEYYDVVSPNKELYATTWFLPESLGKYVSVDAVVEEMKAHGQRYLVFDDKSPRLLGWPAAEWPVPLSRWEREFQVLSPAGAAATVLKLKDE